MNGAVVYRLFDTDGALLYIGSTSDWRRRLYLHGQRSVWIDQVAEISLERHRTLIAARSAEAAAIRIEHPVHNVQHNVTQVRNRRTGRPLGRPRGLAPDASALARAVGTRCRQDVAAAAGISPAHMSGLFHGKARLSRPAAEALATVCGVCVTELFPEAVA